MSSSEWAPSRVMRELMDASQRRRAFELYVEKPEQRDALVDVVTEVRRLRRKFTVGLSVDRLVALALEVTPRSTHVRLIEHVLPGVLHDYVMKEKNETVTGFLDSWSIAHNEGSIEGLVPEIDEGLFAESLETLTDDDDKRRDAALYFAVAGYHMHQWQDLLWSTTNSLAGDDDSPAEDQPEEPDLQIEPETRDAGIEFTTIDDLLIKSVVASVSGATGAFRVEHMADLVSELIGLSADRHQSYFHRGFLSRLSDFEIESEFLERNDSRLGWQLAGEITALARRARWDDIVAVHRSNPEAFRQMFQGAAPHGGRALALPQVFIAYWEQSRQSDAVDLLTDVGVAESPEWFRQRLIDLGEQLLLDRNIAEATRLFELVHLSLEMSSNDNVLAETHARVSRRRGQCLRANGFHEKAIEQFQSMMESAAQKQLSELHSDIGLADGKFRWLDDVSIPSNESEAAAMQSRLRDGEQRFRDAVEIVGDGATNAHYCLGVLELLNRNFGAAIEHLDEALSGALGRSHQYQRVRVLFRLKVYLAIGLLANNNEARYEQAAIYLDGWNQLPSRHRPPWLLAEGTLPVAMASGSMRNQLVELLIKHEPSLVDAFMQEFSIEPDSAPPALVSAITDRSRSERLAEVEWADLEFLLAHHLGKNDDAARKILDDMEFLSTEHSKLVDEFDRMISDAAYYSPAWNEEDAQFSRAAHLERSGRYEQAAAVLDTRFHIYMSDGLFQEAEGLIERVRGYGLAPESFSRMVVRFEEATRDMDSEALTTVDHSVQTQRILFIGGNEIQARQDDAVRSALAESRPNIAVEFIHTGWSGNWGGYLDDIKKKLTAVDAIVVMRYIRTQLGRSVRRSASERQVVWVACTGAGRKSMVRSIISASDLAVIAAGSGTRDD